MEVLWAEGRCEGLETVEGALFVDETLDRDLSWRLIQWRRYHKFAFFTAISNNFRYDWSLAHTHTVLDTRGFYIKRCALLA